MTKGPSSADKEIATLDQRFSEALDVLKKTPGKGKGALLYELPWYMFIGAPGSGKTTALMNSGLTFPLAEKMGGASVRGVGGTRNCDWWFTDEAVLIDTAGRYTTQESNRRSTRAPGTASSPCCASRGRAGRSTACCSPSTSRTCCSRRRPSARSTPPSCARACRSCTRSSACAPPVYVLVTKADLIAGFNEIFDDLGKEERDQVWGFTFPYAPTSADDPLVNFGPSSPRSRSACATASCR